MLAGGGINVYPWIQAAMKPIWLLGLWVAALPCLGAESFIKNPEEIRRIQQAIPARAAVKPTKPRKLLIFTLNVGYGGHPSIAYANEAFAQMGRKTGAFETVVSDDPAVFERQSLESFDAVFFNNTVGNLFEDTALRQSLVEFVYSGGGLMGVHGTSVAFTKWPGAIEDWPEFGIMQNDAAFKAYGYLPSRFILMGLDPDTPRQIAHLKRNRSKRRGRR